MERITFNLEELRYEYPDEPVPPGKTPQGYLEELTWKLAAERYPDGVPGNVRALLVKELALIAELDYARYFLTVYDVVRFAREKAILCQGRGSAANSAVCFCLGITSVDPTRINVLFERFISAERREPPDIDVDFEHERREEVIQYLYSRYTRERAAICSTVIHYRPRMAIREVGKAMGLKEDVTAGLSGLIWGMGDGEIPEAHVREAGLDPRNPELRQAIDLARQLLGFPRHLSQHVGGFVLTRERLDETVPVLNAAMEDRTNIEWDKDDIDALGMLKVDVLALGMLTCIRKAIDLINRHYGKALTLATIPAEDPEVYDMLCRADSVGVFQVESRAQMSMLPRLKPRCFYDLVIEVAIVRPGPIQGDMVHPYLRRRDGVEPVEYPSEALRAVLRQDLRRAPVPGAGHADRHCRRWLFARRGRPSAARDGDVPQCRHDSLVPGEVHYRHDRKRLQPRLRRALLQPDRRLRRVWFSGKPRCQLRPAGLCLLLDQEALSGGLLRGHPQQPADGFLSHRRSSCAMRASIASRCAIPISTSAIGIARWNRPTIPRACPCRAPWTSTGLRRAREGHQPDRAGTRQRAIADMSVGLDAQWRAGRASSSASPTPTRSVPSVSTGARHCGP